MENNKTLSEVQWEKMTELFVREMLNLQGEKLVIERMDRDPEFKQKVILALAVYDSLTEADNRHMLAKIKEDAGLLEAQWRKEDEEGKNA